MMPHREKQTPEGPMKACHKKVSAALRGWCSNGLNDFFVEGSRNLVAVVVRHVIPVRPTESVLFRVRALLVPILWPSPSPAEQRPIGHSSTPQTGKKKEQPKKISLSQMGQTQVRSRQTRATVVFFACSSDDKSSRHRYVDAQAEG